MYYITRAVKKFSSLNNRGVTLIELLIVMAIIGIMTGMVVGRHQDSLYRVKSESVAINFMLELRRLQVQGTAAIATSSAFAVGIHLNDISPHNNKYYVFQDNGNGGSGVDNFYAEVNGDCDGSKECDHLYKLPEGFVFDVCLPGPPIGAINCGSSNKLSISFKRPDQRAHLKKGGGVGSIEYEEAVIKITHPHPEIPDQSIIIKETGLMYIE